MEIGDEVMSTLSLSHFPIPISNFPYTKYTSKYAYILSLEKVSKLNAITTFYELPPFQPNTNSST
jgi:hypothetical protein